MEPKIGKFPIEVFGRVYTDVSDEAIKERKQQYCPYLGRECTKPRKSEHIEKLAYAPLDIRVRSLILTGR